MVGYPSRTKPESGILDCSRLSGRGCAGWRGPDVGKLEHALKDRKVQARRLVRDDASADTKSGPTYLELTEDWMSFDDGWHKPSIERTCGKPF